MAGRLAAVLDLPAVVLVAERAATGEGDATPSATSSGSAELFCLSCGKTDFVAETAKKASPETTNENASSREVATSTIRVASGARSNRSTLESFVTATDTAGGVPPKARRGTPPNWPFSLIFAVLTQPTRHPVNRANRARHALGQNGSAARGNAFRANYRFFGLGDGGRPKNPFGL